MDGQRFDDFARIFAMRASRRAIVRGVVTAAAAGVAAGFGWRGSKAQDDGTPEPDLPLEESPTPTAVPTFEPTVEPTETPTEVASVTPTEVASVTPTETPNLSPTSRADRGTPTPTVRPTEKSGQVNEAAVAQATPTVSISPTSIKVGQSVRFELSGFARSETVAIKWPDGRTLKSIKVGTTGRASFSYTMPAKPRGRYRLAVTGSAGSKTSPAIKIIAVLTLTPTSAYPLARVNATLSGFGSREVVDLLFYPDSTANGSASRRKTLTVRSDGSASGSFSLPSNASWGKHLVVAREQETSAEAKASVTIDKLPCPACSSGACTTCTVGDEVLETQCADQCVGDVCAAVNAFCAEANADADYQRLANHLFSLGYVPDGKAHAAHLDTLLSGLIQAQTVSFKQKSDASQVAHLRYYSTIDGGRIAIALVVDRGTVQWAWIFNNGELTRVYPGMTLAEVRAADHLSNCDNCKLLCSHIGAFAFCSVAGFIVGSLTFGLNPIAAALLALAAGVACNSGSNIGCDKVCAEPCDNPSPCQDGGVCVWVGSVTHKGDYESHAFVNSPRHYGIIEGESDVDSWSISVEFTSKQTIQVNASRSRLYTSKGPYQCSVNAPTTQSTLERTEYLSYSLEQDGFMATIERDVWALLTNNLKNPTGQYRETLTQCGSAESSTYSALLPFSRFAGSPGVMMGESDDHFRRRGTSDAGSFTFQTGHLTASWSWDLVLTRVDAET